MGVHGFVSSGEDEDRMAHENKISVQVFTVSPHATPVKSSGFSALNCKHVRGSDAFDDVPISENRSSVEVHAKRPLQIVTATRRLIR